MEFFKKYVLSQREKVVQFPSTVVLSITTHGEFDVERDKHNHELLQSQSFPFEGDEFIWVKSSVHGVVNWFSKEDAKRLNEFIQRSFYNILLPSSSDPPPSFFSFQKQKLYNSPKSPEIIQTVKRIIKSIKNIDNNPSNASPDYYHTFPQRYGTYKYNKNENIRNKTFLVDLYDMTSVYGNDLRNKIKGEDTNFHKHDWTIKILNGKPSSGESDFFKLFFGLKEKGYENIRHYIRDKIDKAETESEKKKCRWLEVSLKDVLKYLTDHGAKNIVIFDFTCSVFEDPTTRYYSSPINKDLPSSEKRRIESAHEKKREIHNRNMLRIARRTRRTWNNEDLHHRLSPVKVSSQTRKRKRRSSSSNSSSSTGIRNKNKRK